MCLFFVTDVGFGGWENLWEIMYHSANVTKYVGLEPLRPSSIIRGVNASKISDGDCKEEEFLNVVVVGRGR